MTSRWLSLHHAAEHLDLNTEQLRRLVRKGIVPKPEHHNGRAYWSEKALDAIFDQPPPPPPKLKPSSFQLPKSPPTTALLSISAILAAASELPSIASGIYFLIKDQPIVYVGQSRHILRRMIDHMKAWKFDAWHWIACAPDELNKLEQRYIQSLRPAWIEKFAANRSRDARNERLLHDRGWRVLTVWECGVRGRAALPISAVAEMVEAWLRSTNLTDEIAGRPLSRLK